MASDALLAEALARIEHKVDVIYARLKQIDPKMQAAQVGQLGHTCPFCMNMVDHVIDASSKVVIRRCGCKTGKIAPVDLDALAPPPAGKSRSVYGPGAREEEDGDDSGSDGGPRGR